MFKTRRDNSDQRGATLVEFAIAATVFLTAMFAVVEFGRALWVHNALTDAARRGARYAVLHPASDIDSVKNVVVYGDPAGTGNPMVENLTAGNVSVNYSGYGLNAGTVTVSVTNYEFQLILPLVVTSIQMSNYSTTLTGESAGWVPPDM